MACALAGCATKTQAQPLRGSPIQEEQYEEPHHWHHSQKPKCDPRPVPYIFVASRKTNATDPSTTPK